jgi:hypothetical protein
MLMLDIPKCVICDSPAITTAAQILVCARCYNEYADEARKYLPFNQRYFYRILLYADNIRKKNA